MKSATGGPAPVPTDAEAELNRQYPKYYVVKGHLAQILEQLVPGEALPPRASLAEDSRPVGPPSARH